MIDIAAVAALASQGFIVTLLPDGSMRVQSAPDDRSPAARRQAAYRERNAASQNVTNRNDPSHVTASSPPLSPSPLSPQTPLSPPPSHTPAPAGSRTCGHEADGLTLAAELEPAPPKPSKNLPTSDQAKRIATMFKRRLSTPWQSREVSALRNLGTIEETDLAAVEAYYSAHWPPDRNKNVLRHDLGTLLNNFRGEVDRAQAWQRKSAPTAADTTKRDFWARSALADKPQTQTTPTP